MLDTLRFITLSLALFSIGINLAIFKNGVEPHERVLAIGRIGVLFAVSLIVLIRLLHNHGEIYSYFFNVVLIISLLIGNIGGYRYYRHQEEEDDKSIRRR